MNVDLNEWKIGNRDTYYTHMNNLTPIRIKTLFCPYCYSSFDMFDLSPQMNEFDCIVYNIYSHLVLKHFVPYFKNKYSNEQLPAPDLTLGTAAKLFKYYYNRITGLEEEFKLFCFAQRLMR